VSRRVCLTAAAIAAWTLGCQQPLSFDALTSPPPFAQAELAEDSAGNTSITLTAGVALAFSCTEPQTADPCSPLSATVQDPSVAEVFPGYLAALTPGADGDLPQGTLVIVGLSAGTTTLNVSSSDDSASIAVSIVGR
jgi:hypothetical protein